MTMRIKRRTEVWLQDAFEIMKAYPGGYRLGKMLFRALGRAPLFSANPKQRPQAKLNIACGERRFPGWTNVDVRLSGPVSAVCDVRALPFQRASFDLVYASHILEHIPPREVPATIQEWSRVLRPGGWIMVAVPDFDWVVRQYRKNPLILDIAKRGVAATPLVCLYGEAFAEDKPWYEHWMSYNFESLSAVLARHGKFSDFRRFNYWDEEPFQLGMFDASMGPYSLNVAARKDSPALDAP